MIPNPTSEISIKRRPYTPILSPEPHSKILPSAILNAQDTITMPSLHINTSTTSNSKALSDGELQRIKDYQDALEATARWQQDIAPTFGSPDHEILPDSFIDEETGRKIQEYLNEGSIPSRAPSPSADEDEGSDIYVNDEEQMKIDERSREAMPLTIHPDQEQEKDYDEPETIAAGSSPQETFAMTPRTKAKWEAIPSPSPIWSASQSVKERWASPPSPTWDQAALNRMKEIEKALQAVKTSHQGTTAGTTTKEKGSIFGPVPTETQWKFDFHKFAHANEDQGVLKTQIQQTANEPEVQKGLLNYQGYQSAYSLLTPIRRELLLLQGETRQVYDLAIKANERNNMLEEQLTKVMRQLITSQKEAVSNVPMEPLRKHFPGCFQPEGKKRTSTDAREKYIPQRPGRQTPPNDQYDHTNPRWDNQAPRFTRKPKRWYGFHTGDLAQNIKTDNATSVRCMDTSNGTVPNTPVLIVTTIVDTDLINVHKAPLAATDETPQYNVSQ